MSEVDNSPALETKERPAKEPPEKLAPPTVAGYSIVVLQLGEDCDRIEHQLKQLASAEEFSPLPLCPFIICRGLAIDEATAVQADLICTDTITVFVEDPIVEHVDREQLIRLTAPFRAAREFETVTVCVEHLPDDDRGTRFLQRFFGRHLPAPAIVRATRKKARLMREWAERIGGAVDAEVDLN